MYGNPIHHVYIADGFLDDCEQLISRCLKKQEILDFQTFCFVWKEMNLGCLYQGRNSGAEVAELSEEVLQIAKHYMIANTSNYEESVAGLFLVYSLLNLQPYTGFAALRLVPEDVSAISRLETVARRERRYDVLYILGSVLIKGPCQYHAAERERGMEASIKKYLDGFRSIDSIRGVQPKGVFYRQNEELDIIKELGTLTKRYSEAKASVIGSGPSDRSLQYINEELPTELNDSLRKVVSGIIEEVEEDPIKHGKQEKSTDHISLVEAIKAKAMRDTVNPMKHLTGIEDRKNLKNTSPQQSAIKSDIQTIPGKIKTSILTKPQTSLKKRELSPNGNNYKKRKTNPGTVANIKTEHKSNNNDVHEHDITISDEEENTDSEEDIESENLDIESLPIIMSTEENGDLLDMTSINEYNKVESDKSEEDTSDIIRLSLPDISTISFNTPTECPDAGESSESTMSYNEDYKKFQMVQQKLPNIKLQKRQHLKSKLKRLGVLPVANLEDSNSN